MPSKNVFSSVLSLYIPIISNTTTEGYIKKMFETNKIGKIMRVDFVYNKAKDRNEAFVHFDEWFDSNESKSLKEDILDPNTKTQFKYSATTTKFWPLLVNRNAHKRVNNPNYEIVDATKLKMEYKKSLNMKNKLKAETNDAKKTKATIEVN